MDRLTTVFKLLSDETRLRIIVLLKQEQLSVCEICSILDLPQPKVSKHLARLRDLGMVVGDRVENFVFYSPRLMDPPLCNLIDDIIANVNAYPILENDKLRLETKSVQFDKCGPEIVRVKNNH
ncbi:winged helix-turn-helix transcriptional regulator [Acidaminobacter sp. JC074]|uniref:ArsR/SmtB family transcription factor n=1 Tax=Acidaminobacter sp. JC074 TaxID=2530199 RepID=UPI001F0D4129|nr:winged helix-turn-helix transcriptional regulator [Acidaminobacter sp. JC074]